MHACRTRWVAACLVFCGLCAGLPQNAWAGDAKTIRARGIELAAVAKSRAKAKSFGLAAQMFHEAYNIDRAEWSYLFSAARCEQLDGDLTRAAVTYRRFLGIAPTDHALRPRAAAELARIETAQLAKEAAANADPDEPGPPPMPGDEPAPAKPPTLAPPAVRQAPTSSWQSPVGWTALVVGVLAGGTGGALFAMATDDKRALEGAVKKDPTASGLITSHSHEDAQKEKNAIEGRLLTWGIVTGAAAGVALVGAIVLATSPSTKGIRASVGADGSLHVGWMTRF